MLVIFIGFLSPLFVFGQGDELLNQSVNAKHFVGVSAGVMINGKVDWKGAAGLADQKQQLPVNTEMLFRTASIAKPMTSAAILQLVEKGLIDLNAPVSTYIEDFPKTEFSSEITIKRLLNHTAGIDGYQKRESENKTFYPTLTEAMNVFIDRPLVGTPGEVYQYSSYGFVVLGVVIERVSGMSYSEYMKTNIWDKAGMTNTGVVKYGETLENQVSLYHRNNKGKIKPGTENDLSNRLPGGGFYSNVSDLLKFGNALMDGTLISSASFEQMLTSGGVETGGNAYGLGLYLYGENPKHGNVAGHTGEQTGTASVLILMPEVKSVIVVMSNTSGALREAFQLTVRLFQLAPSTN